MQSKHVTVLISRFRRGVIEIFDVVGCYRTYIGSYQTFRYYLLVPSSKVSGQLSVPSSRVLLKMGSVDCPETSVTNYQSTLCNIPKERRSQVFVESVTENSELEIS
jgi:hypothetical protein